MIENEMPPEEELPEDGLEEEDEAGSPEETEAYETMVAGLREHIFGAAEEGIREKLRTTEDLHTDVGNMALALVMEAGKQAGDSGIDADFEMLLNVGTEIIDDLLDIAEAMGVLEEITDDDRSKSLLAAVRAYLSSADVPPEEQEAAKQALQQMQMDGAVDETASELSAMGEREGVDPFADEEQPPEQPQRPGLMGA